MTPGEERRQEEKSEKDVIEFGNALEKNAEAQKIIFQVERSMGEDLKKKNFNLDDYDEKKDDLSGITLPVIGTRVAMPGAQDTLRNFSRLFNNLLKLRSGTAVTDNELVRMEREFGEGLYETEGSRVKALAELRDILQTAAKMGKAGVPKEALDRFNKDTGLDYRHYTGEKKYSFKDSKEAKSDMVKVIRKDGKVGSIPKSKLEAALKSGKYTEAK